MGVLVGMLVGWCVGVLVGWLSAEGCCKQSSFVALTANSRGTSAHRSMVNDVTETNACVRACVRAVSAVHTVHVGRLGKTHSALFCADIVEQRRMPVQQQCPSERNCSTYERTCAKIRALIVVGTFV